MKIYDKEKIEKMKNGELHREKKQTREELQKQKRLHEKFGEDHKFANHRMFYIKRLNEKLNHINKLLNERSK